MNGRQRYSHPISIPISGRPAASSPIITLTPDKTEILLGNPLTVTVDTAGTFTELQGRWYVDMGSGFYASSSINLAGLKSVTYTPTRGTQLYLEVAGKTESGSLVVRTPVISITNGSPAASGDANADGSVDLQDVLLILQYEAGWTVSPDPYHSDVNADGKVTMADALLLLELLAK